MPPVIKLKRGLDIPLKGEAPKIVVQAPLPKIISVKPTDFRGLTPKLLVKEGDVVAAGAPLFADKCRPRILFTAPVGGVVGAIVRGEKRKLLSIDIQCTHDEEPRAFPMGHPNAESHASSVNHTEAERHTSHVGRPNAEPNASSVNHPGVERHTSHVGRPNAEPRASSVNHTEAKQRAFPVSHTEALSREQIVEILLQSGCWPCLIQRPYGVIANPEDVPRAIFISAFDTAPLAPDLDFILAGQEADLQRGIDVLRKLSPKGGVYWSARNQLSPSNLLAHPNNVHTHLFEGKHPAGNVGVQIHHIAPISKGEVVWTIDPQSVVVIGRLFSTGVLDTRKMVALTGPSATKPCYLSILPGTPFSAIPHIGAHNPAVRYISGNCLTGNDVGYHGSLGFYHHQITLLPEGDHFELLGWAKLYRPKTFSVSRSYFSWLSPKKRYRLDTNMNGGVRAFVVSDVYAKVLPMDLYPTYLLKAIWAGDIDKMEALGIYEVIEEDFALCEFVCPSKINIQELIANGIDLMIKEMS